MYASTVLICMEFLSAGGIDIAMLFQPLNCLFRCFHMNRCQKGGYHHSTGDRGQFFVSFFECIIISNSTDLNCVEAKKTTPQWSGFVELRGFEPLASTMRM